MATTLVTATICAALPVRFTGHAPKGGRKKEAGFETPEVETGTRGKW